MSIHSYEELATLHAIAKILAQPQNLHDQLEQVLQEMSSRLGMKRGMISLLDREKKEAWLDIAHDVNIEGMDVTYKPGEGITGKVAETGRPMAVANLGQATHFLDRTGARRHLNRSELAFLCVPIIYDANVVGVLSADKVALEVEDLDKELAMLSAVAELMAKAVHIRALEEENERLRKIVGSDACAFHRYYRPFQADAGSIRSGGPGIRFQYDRLNHRRNRNRQRINRQSNPHELSPARWAAGAG